MTIFLGMLFVLVCVLLIIVVLLQKGRGGGLSGAFGGGGGSSAFGTRTGDVFTWVTIVLVALFLLLAIVTTLVWREPTVRSGQEQRGAIPLNPQTDENGDSVGTGLMGELEGVRTPADPNEVMSTTQPVTTTQPQ